MYNTKLGYEATHKLSRNLDNLLTINTKKYSFKKIEEYINQLKSDLNHYTFIDKKVKLYTIDYNKEKSEITVYFNSNNYKHKLFNINKSILYTAKVKINKKNLFIKDFLLKSKPNDKVLISFLILDIIKVGNALIDIDLITINKNINLWKKITNKLIRRK